ncbi:MAG: hypothetical protein FJZ80_02615 [Bacteroidetes bacterium]|nr:hypothetical protein [Bacteroidota bacterium]
MRRFKQQHIIGSLLALILCSCSDLRQKEQLKAITNLSLTLDSIQRVAIGNFPDTLNQVRFEMMRVETSLKNKLLLDTIYHDYAFDMDTYKKARKSIGKANEYFVELKRSLEKQRNQLKALKKDVENGWGRRDQYGNYIRMERKNLRTLASRSANLQKKIVTIYETYRLLHPKLVKFLERVESKKGEI